MKYLRPMGIPTGTNSPRGMGMGRKSPPWHLTRMGMGNFLPHGDGDGEALPDGEFPVDIWSLDGVAGGRGADVARAGAT